MQKIFFLLALGATLASCNEDFFSQVVEVDPPAFEKRLVLHLFAADSAELYQATLTRNIGIFENPEGTKEYWEVKDGAVEIYENGTVVLALAPDPFSNTPGVFSIQAPPDLFKSGKSYELRARAKDYESVNAVQVMPSELIVDPEIVFRPKAGLDPEGSELSAFDIYIEDKAGEKNYYEVSAKQRYYNLFFTYNPDGSILKIDTLGYNDYEIGSSSFDDPNIQSGLDGEGLVSDQFFDGKRYKFSYKTYSLEGIQGAVFIRVRSVTEDYYRYKLTLARREESEDLPLVEPTIVHNNIQNGIGIFVLYRERNFTKQL